MKITEPQEQLTEMQKLFITGPKQAAFHDVESPVCAPDGVVVRARLTAISTGTELRVFRAVPVDEAGRFLHENLPFQLPAENGYSMVGDVIEVGADVDGVATGDRVYVPASHAQFAAVSAANVTALPDVIPDEEAVMLSILEVGHLALRQGDPPAGANVAVIGQGVIGLALTAFADAFGFRTAVLDMSPERLQIARKMGVLVAAHATDSDAIHQIRDLFGGEGADVAFEATSHWSGIRTAMEMTRTDGKVVVVSRNTSVPDFNPVGHPFLGKRLNLMTSYGHPAPGCRWSCDRTSALTIDLLARRRLKIAPMLTHRFSWEEIPEVYRRMDAADHSIVGAIIDWPAGDGTG